MEQKKKRFAFIDLYRGWALLFMIETHIFNAMLNPADKATGWFNILTFINGWVAPSFLFISGFAFNIASQRKLEEFRKYKFEFWRQLGRIFLIFLVGYSLRLPYLSLQKMLHKATPQELLPFFSVDVLQCIALGLLLMFILKLTIRSEIVYNSILTIMTGIVFILAPQVWKINLSPYLPLPLANYFNPQNDSLFPIFPWLGFILSGSVCSFLYMKAKKLGNEQIFLKQALFWSICAIVIGVFVLSTPFSFLDILSKPVPNQFFFLLRIGIVVLLLIIMRYYELWRQTEKSFVLDIGMESLIVYWLHLQIIYRKLWNDKTLYSIVHESFNFYECLLATMALILLMVITAKLWNKIKLRSRLFSQILTVLTITTLILVFLTR